MRPVAIGPCTAVAHKVGSAADNAGHPIDGEGWHFAFVEVWENVILE